MIYTFLSFISLSIPFIFIKKTQNRFIQLYPIEKVDFSCYDKTNIINVCWIFDIKNEYQALISLGSIIKSNPGQSFNFYLINPPNQTINLTNFLLIKPKNSKIIVTKYEPIHAYLSERENLTCIWSNIIIVKINLRDVLPNVDKVLYLDTDTVNVSPLDQMWKVPLEKRIFAAPRRIFLKFMYINSGVILYNLKYLRQKNDDLWKCANKRLCPVDDNWHIHCNGREFIELPYRYNVEFYPMIHKDYWSKLLLDENEKACIFHLKDFYHNYYTTNISFFKNISLFANNPKAVREMERLYSIAEWIKEKINQKKQ